MLNRRTRNRWVRVVVWWGVLACAFAGIAVGVVVHAGGTRIANLRAQSAITLRRPIAHGDLGPSESLHIESIGATRTRGESVWMVSFVQSRKFTEPPPPVPLMQWLTDEEARKQAQTRRGPARRLRDLLGNLRNEQGWPLHIVAMDVAAIAPVGMVIQPTYRTDPIEIPREVRRVYPIAIPLASGTSWILIRGWSVLGWSVALGGVIAVMPELVRSVRRVVRRVVRRRRGACEACGYSLVGIEGAVCPECGEKREG